MFLVMICAPLCILRPISPFWTFSGLQEADFYSLTLVKLLGELRISTRTKLTHFLEIKTPNYLFSCYIFYHLSSFIYLCYVYECSVRLYAGALCACLVPEVASKGRQILWDSHS